MTQAPRSDRGSVLVDALVAIGVMTIAVILGAQAVGDAARRTGAGERTRLAELEARSRMAEVGADIPLLTGEVQGEDAGLAWKVEISPAGEAGLAAASPHLMEVLVSVGVPSGRRLVSLRSYRMGGA